MNLTKPLWPHLAPIDHAARNLVCPHCQAQGTVVRRGATVKRGVSGGKATGVLLTGGLSMLFTGLSRKQAVTQSCCTNCGSTWTIE